jgi:hypothetical protein
MNGERNDRRALDDDIFDFLRRQSLDTFRPLVDYNKLTFIKGCRFFDVNLSREGIETVGHVWKLGKTFTIADNGSSSDNESDSGNGSSSDNKSDSGDGLNTYQRRQLRQLAMKLKSGHYGKRYEEIANDIFRYLDQDNRYESDNFPKKYKDLMAEGVVEAIRTRKMLRLACIVPLDYQNPRKAYAPYRGIFVSETNETSKRWDEQQPSYVFTASCLAHENKDNIDRHVSLEVEWRNSTKKGWPRLVIKRWINGLCFFDGCRRQNVVFPWPKSLSK